jgi:hypothetical protein
MKQMFAVVLLISATLAACGGKKESTTPVSKDQPAMEQKGDATGGAAYGKKPDGAAKDSANPCAPK